MIEENYRFSIQKYAMFLLAAFPVLNSYVLFGEFTIARFVLLILFIICISKGAFSLNEYPKLYLVFWAYAALHLIIYSGAFKVTYLIPGGVNLFFYSISLFVFCHFYNSSYFKNYIWYVFLFATALFFYQLIVFNLSGTRLSVFLPLTDNIAYSVKTYNELVQVQNSFEDRFSSIFLEPSYYGQFALIVLTIELFREENKNKLITLRAAFIIIVELLIKSGVGLIGLIVVALLKLIHVVFVLKQKQYIVYLVLFAPIFLYGINYYLNSNMGSGISDRANFETNVNGEFADQSANERLLYGFWEFDRLDDFDKIIGTTRVNRIIIAERNHAINGFSSSLITYGVIGTILILFYYISICRMKSILSIAFAIVLLVVSFAETILFDDFMLICTTIISCEYIKDSLNLCIVKNGRY